MRTHGMFLLCSLLAGASSGEVLTLDPTATKVTFDLEATGHDVHGTLVLKAGNLTFDRESGTAIGRIVVDATSAATGSSSRDSTMHDDVLESARFPTFSFEAERFEGTLPEVGTGRITLHGSLDIHGVHHPLAVPAEVVFGEGGRLTGSAHFDIPYVAWGMRDPSLFVLRVAKTVRVEIAVVGRIAASATMPAGAR